MRRNAYQEVLEKMADLQFDVEETDDGVLLTAIDAARLTFELPRRSAAELLEGLGLCQRTGARRTTDTVDVWDAGGGSFGVHLRVPGALSWTCPALSAASVDALAAGLLAALL